MPFARNRVARRLAGLLIPIGLVVLAWYVHRFAPIAWDRPCGLAIAFACCVCIATRTRGRTRDTVVTGASLVLALAAIETWATWHTTTTIDINTPGYSVSQPILGWGPQYPGVFHHTKLDARTGRAKFEVDYTIDEDLHRVVRSAETGPAVAFFGDSATFGSGLADADTLPQAFADATGQKIRVLDLAFPGYGPQQFLRALETGLYDVLLTPSRLFVFQTSAWHIERSSCKVSFMMRAPRYVLVDGRAVFAGACAAYGPPRFVEAFTGSATWQSYIRPLLFNIGPVDVDLYVAILARAGALAREKYGVPTAILYVPSDAYARRAGSSDAEITKRLRDAGLLVVDGALDPSAFPGRPLEIPGDGHPTGTANRARAAILVKALAAIPQRGIP